MTSAPRWNIIHADGPRSNAAAAACPAADWHEDVPRIHLGLSYPRQLCSLTGQSQTLGTCSIRDLTLGKGGDRQGRSGLERLGLRNLGGKPLNLRPG